MFVEAVEVLCEIKWPLHYKEGSLVEACPRYALRKQLHSLQQLGLHLMSAFEMEFVLLKKGSILPVFKSNQSLTESFAFFEDYLFSIEKTCSTANINIETMMVENGAGQFELVLTPKMGGDTADECTLMRQLIKEVSKSFNYTSTFMSLPFQGSAPSAAHLNVSLWTEDAQGKRTNAFYDANDPDSLSSVFRHFLAGLIKHSRALCAFWCPTVNCYRRLQKMVCLPTFNWDVDNRKTAFRVKKDSEKGVYIECRKPSSLCNYHLATAATIAAGIAGIRNKLPLHERHNILFDPKKIGIPHGETFPKSLKEALEELETNVALKRELGEELIGFYVKSKTKNEVVLFERLKEDEKLQKEQELYLFD